jgi:hypothetical protein
MARFVFLLRTIDLSANAGKVLREWLSRRWRFPRLRLPTAEKACWSRNILAWSTGSVVALREFQPPRLLWDNRRSNHGGSASVMVAAALELSAALAALVAAEAAVVPAMVAPGAAVAGAYGQEPPAWVAA